MTLQIELLEEKKRGGGLEIFRQIQKLLKEEDLVDKKARQKILSQKREILEGSAEWDILFRKYYSEEDTKARIDLRQRCRMNETPAHAS